MLVAEKISFGFPHRPLLKDLSLRLKRGELIHVSGPNGAGKSTLMALLAGLLPPDAGNIEFRDGQGQATYDPRSFIEYVPAEANALFLKMNGLKNLEFWVRLRHAAHTSQIQVGKKHTAEDLIKELTFWGLGHPILLGHFPVEKYSTGMKRRLALARLRLAATPCWLLDEPVYGLDAHATECFRNVLKDHLAHGGMALMISHDLAALQDIPHERLELGFSALKTGAGT